MTTEGFLFLALLCIGVYATIRMRTHLAVLSDTAAGTKDAGYIYVFRGRYEPFWLVKIGKAKDVVQRMKSHRTANPHGVKMLAVIRVKNMTTAERNIHHRFKNLRRNGEWFLLSPALWMYVLCMKSQPETRDTQRKLEWA